VNAECKCSWNAEKNKYCDILPGDDEWVDAREAFREYFLATRNDCNTAARWEPCGKYELYNDWQCKKLKAENYVWLRSASSLQCMPNLWNDLPMFAQEALYCVSTLLSVTFASLSFIIIY